MRNDHRSEDTHQSGGGLGFIVLLMIIGVATAFVAIQQKPVASSRVYIMETVPMAKNLREERDYLAGGS
jgi:hypothetical protein